MTSPNIRGLKVCYVLSYKDPNYIRTTTLLASLAQIDGVEIYKAINTKKNVLRYAETLLKLTWNRVKNHPDVYILGFRGLEIFWLVRFITLGKPLLYDEFVEPVEWFTVEHQKFSVDSILGKALKAYNHWALSRASAVLSDTDANAKHSAKINNISIGKYKSVWVGTDEETFKPVNIAPTNDIFTVFFYGSMLPLHGVSYLLDAIRYTDDNIHFHIVGGQLETQINSLGSGEKSRLTYQRWIPYKELPAAVAKANLCIGGPFGGTPQSMRVITGKTFQFMAMGKPVLIGKTDVDSPLTDGENCLTVRQRSPKEIANKINWANSHQEQLKKLSQNGLTTYHQYFSVSANAVVLKELLFNLGLLK